MPRAHERWLFDQDVAADVRGDYREAIEDGLSPDEATARVLSSYADVLADEDNGPAVRLALAVAQSQLGRLDAGTRDAALEVIHRGAGLTRWDAAGQKEGERARRMHAAIAEQLTGPQPKASEPRRTYRPTTVLTPGQVLAYRHDDGTYTLSRVARVESSRYGDTPVLVVLRWDKDHLPPARRLPGLKDEPDLPFDTPWHPRDTSVMGPSKNGRSDPDFHDLGLEVVGQVPVKPDRFYCNLYTSWSSFVRHLEQRHDPVGWWQHNNPDQPVPDRWRAKR